MTGKDGELLSKKLSHAAGPVCGLEAGCGSMPNRAQEASGREREAYGFDGDLAMVLDWNSMTTLSVNARHWNPFRVAQ